MIEQPCADRNSGRRRIFWTTRQGACGDYSVCGTQCAIPGLQYVEEADDGRTIRNDEWLESLILNILNTRARTDAKCPSPAAVYGHWSESYRGDGLYIGSKMWNAATKSYIRTADAVKAINAAVTADVSKLVAQGLANSVDVETVYRSHNRVDIIITATVMNASHTLNLSGSLSSGNWFWH
jgi:Phage protein GP46